METSGQNMIWQRDDHLQPDGKQRAGGLPAVALATLLLLAASLTGSMAARADASIASWVDANGVTHFGDWHLAPAHASTVAVGDTNGMVAPEITSRRPKARTQWTMIERAPKQNPKGWRSKGDGPRYGPISR